MPPAELYSCPVNFNPPAPCGAGLQDRVNELLNSKISIHPPRAGRDYRCTTTSATYLAFQSTRPVRGGTLSLPRLLHRRGISIHPPRAGRDFHALPLIRSVAISIHPPRAGRDAQYGRRFETFQISIHPPRAGRDAPMRKRIICQKISIHPPRAGRDAWSITAICCCRNFNPPAPCGAGLLSLSLWFVLCSFQSTRPVRGGTFLILAFCWAV